MTKTGPLITTMAESSPLTMMPGCHNGSDRYEFVVVVHVITFGEDVIAQLQDCICSFMLFFVDYAH